jgi:hypothetical protein
MTALKPASLYSRTLFAVSTTKPEYHGIWIHVITEFIEYCSVQRNIARLGAFYPDAR